MAVQINITQTVCRGRRLARGKGRHHNLVSRGRAVCVEYEKCMFENMGMGFEMWEIPGF